MDIDELRKILAFLNWEVLLAVAVISMATVQFFKEYIPDVYKGVPTMKLFTLLVGLLVSHFVFDISGAKHTETIALFTGFVSALLAALGYEVLKGTKLGLRSSDNLKNGGRS